MSTTMTTAPAAAVIDTETSGFRYKGSDRILEIAIVRLNADGSEADRWSTLLNPGPQADIGPVDIHGITREHLVDAPSFSDVVGDIASRLSNAVVVAHNASFDVGFLKAEFARAGLAWPEPVVRDTLGAARYLIPGLPTYKLAALAEHLGITFDGAEHSALADALVTAELYRRLEGLTSGVSWAGKVDVQWPTIAPSGIFVTR